MSTAAPKPATTTPKPSAQPAVQPDESDPTVEPDEQGPQVERVNMAGLILEKTLHEDGQCETRTIREPMIAPELIRATRASQRARGH